MTTRAETVLQDSPEVTIVYGHQTKWFIIGDRVLFRFKKGNQNGLSSNVATTQALAFHDPQENLPGIPDLIRVEAVYVLNDLATGIESLHVVRRSRARVAWSYQLGLPTADNVVTIDHRHTIETDTPTHTVVKPKTTEASRRGTNSDESGDGQ
jgi:hypothetical protein